MGIVRFDGMQRGTFRTSVSANTSCTDCAIACDIGTDSDDTSMDSATRLAHWTTYDRERNRSPMNRHILMWQLSIFALGLVLMWLLLHPQAIHFARRGPTAWMAKDRASLWLDRDFHAPERVQAVYPVRTSTAVVAWPAAGPTRDDGG